MSELLTDEERAEQLKKWIKEYGMAVVLALVLGIGGVIGWNYYQDYSVGVDEGASDAFADYLESRGLGLPIDEHVELIESEYGHSGYVLLLYLYQAKDAVADEDYGSALKILQKAQDVGSGTSLEDLISIRIAKVLYQLERQQEALNVLQSLGSGQFQSLALELQGDIYRSMSEFEDARKSYIASIEALPEEFSPDILKQKLGVLPVQ